MKSEVPAQPEADAIRELAAKLVGVVDMKQAQRSLRKAMHREALLRTRGSHRGAAKLLGVDRRYVQRMNGEP